MLLYATTTSERASKGQGGNDFLSLDIRNEKAELLAGIVIKPASKGYPLSITVSDQSSEEFLKVLKNHISFTLDKIKGNQQKGE